MKELYLTSENLTVKTKKYLNYLNKYFNINKIQFHPDKAALLILDIQKYFIDDKSHAFVPSVKTILPGLKKLCQLCKSKNIPLIFTRHLNNFENAGMMNKWWKDLISDDDRSSITKKLSEYTDIVITKTQYDAFYNTNLDSILKNYGIQQVIIGGVLTHLCCETTARSAFVRGYEVFFLIDGTATYNETFHMNTLYNLSHGFAKPTTITDIEQTLSEFSK